MPELLQGFANYLMKQDTSSKNYIGINEFVLIYSTLIRGSPEEKAQTISGVIGYRKNSAGIKTVSYNNLLKVNTMFVSLIFIYFFELQVNLDIWPLRIIINVLVHVLIDLA